MDESPAPVVAPRRPRSPPLAFQTTSNDSLWAPLNHTSNGSSAVRSPTASQLSEMHVSASEMDMQFQIDKLAEALRLQNKAFAAERDSWQLEKDRLYRRISSLESLLRGTENGHSPAKSPLASPHSGNIYTPTQPRPSTSLPNSRLASIAEAEPSSPLDENRRPLPHLKRGSAPMSIALPPKPTVAVPFDAPDTTMDDKRAIDMLDDIAVKPDLIDEVPRSPPQSRLPLSPPPPANRHHAGHTPLRTGSPAPSNFGPHLDTPTRSNTALNEILKDDVDEDRPLKGPLMLPELPQALDEENFTMTMLDAKLQDLIEHPEDSEPVVLKMTSPAAAMLDEADVNTGRADSKIAEHHQGSKSKTASLSASKTASVSVSKAASVSASKAASVSASKAVSPSVARVDDPLDQGITLRTKPGTNFGAPLGQMNPMWKQ